MPIKTMPFEEAVSTFRRYYESVCRNKEYCPDNIWITTLGYQCPNVHATPGYMNQLIPFVNDVIIENDTGPEFETLCTDKRFPTLRGNMNDMRTMVDILTPGLTTKIRDKVRALGAHSHDIIYQCPRIFIEDLFEEVDRRHITIPREVRLFYNALHSLAIYIYIVLIMPKMVAIKK